MCVSVGAGGGGVSRRQSRELQSAEHLDAALLTDVSVETVDRLAARMSMSVEVMVV